MLDFTEIEQGKLRYNPNDEILNCIINIENGCNGCFGSYGLLAFLNFLDLLGWNEDDKYHIINNEPNFDDSNKFNTGRINTLLSCIAIPALTFDFINHILEKKDTTNEINHNIINDITQRLIKSRGICVPKNDEIKKWLSPYIIN